MTRRITLMTVFGLSLAGCQPGSGLVTNAAPLGDILAAQAESEGLVRKDIPNEDPGPPFYARVTNVMNEFFHADGWLAIPFYRDPDCIPADFNMMELFDFPGPGGPGAFACPLLMEGFLLTEPDAPLGMFPRHVFLTSEASPFWFVRWSDFQSEAADGVVTIGDIVNLGPLKGIASRYHETLKPREGDHVIAIQATGTLEDGRTFQFGVMHLEDSTQSIRIRFR